MRRDACVAGHRWLTAAVQLFLMSDESHHYDIDADVEQGNFGDRGVAT